jgi:hypothetical protein
LTLHPDAVKMKYQLHKNKSVNYLEGFWEGLLKDSTAYAVYFLRSSIPRFKQWYKTHKPKHLDVHIKITFTRLIIIGYLAFNLWPHPSPHTVAVSPKPKPVVPVVSDLKPISDPIPAQQEELVPVAPPAPVAPVQQPRVASGCVTGVTTGNFYEDFIIAHESGGNTCAVNASSGACNLFQELPCGKSGCSSSDVACELAWGTGYATSRYGGWAGAYAFWTAHSWW